MCEERLYQVALSLVPHIGPVQARILTDHFGTAKSVFAASVSTLKKMEGIGEVRAQSLRRFNGFAIAESEMRFMEKENIQPLFITDAMYPYRLLHCNDAPVLLYYKGVANLNATRVLSVVGSRRHSNYGKNMTEKLLEGLMTQDVIIVSGLAHGIDAIAHRAALKNTLPTIGVLAHGLDQVYPPQHALLAQEMLKQGGLLTEFRSHSMPDRHHFPNRNRIVAGMSDATIVIETGNKGGSMITAELANGYNRDVFAFPGKVTDAKSTGCNTLIRNNKAILLTEARDLLELLGWERSQKPSAPVQRQIFVELSPDERQLVTIFQEKEMMTIDEINQRAHLSTSAVAAALLGLELKNLLMVLPGKQYRLQ